MIHVIESKATEAQVTEMLESLESYIKLAVDIETGIVAGGGTMHADCEAALLENGSKQENIWGADWLPYAKEVTYESLINIRPRQNNFSMTIQSEDLRERIRSIVLDKLGAK
jgi:hypothetical protein